MEMRALDPVDIEMRKAYRLCRRVYYAKGPVLYDIWTVETNVNHKHAVNRYSRKIIWLEVSDSNNDPRLIARYFLTPLMTNTKSPHPILRCDVGTENCIALLLQEYFSHDSTDPIAGTQSVVVGKSTSNQRIEKWWCTLRQNEIHWWINFFQRLTRYMCI